VALLKIIGIQLPVRGPYKSGEPDFLKALGCL
jgi:hypothetical protein